jgi:hypothetical protein
MDGNTPIHFSYNGRNGDYHCYRSCFDYSENEASQIAGKLKNHDMIDNITCK